MAEYDVRGPGGQTFRVTAPDNASREDIIARARAMSRPAPAAAPQPAPSAPPAPPPADDGRSVLSGALADTFGLTDRPGAVPLTGTRDVKTPAGVVLKPEGGLEHAISAAVTAPAVAGGGALAQGARLAPVVGRVLTTGALGTAKKAAEGGTGTDAASAGARDAATAGVTEAVIEAAMRGVPIGKLIPGSAGTLLQKINVPGLRDANVVDRARRGWEYYGGQIRRALDQVPGLPRGAWMRVDALKPNGRMTVDEALEGLAKTTDNGTFQRAVDQITYNLRQMDRWLVKGGARQMPTMAARELKRNLPDERFLYEGTPFQRVVSAISRTLDANPAKAVADTAVTTAAEPVTSGVERGVRKALP